MSDDITLDEIIDAYNNLVKSGYHADHLVSPVFNYMDLPHEYSLKDNTIVEASLNESTEFLKTYKYPIWKCKNKKEFEQKMMVIRL